MNIHISLIRHTIVIALAFIVGAPENLAAQEHRSGTDGGIEYTELDDPAVRAFVHTGSTTQAIAEAWHQTATPDHPVSTTEAIFQPMMPRGLPGTAMLDYDNDGDLDIYATNGPGSANTLLSNQLHETGSVAFIDVANVAGVEATDMDSFGVCFGDTDNDGDPDLMVLGRNEPNRFFVNNGDGTMTRLDNGAGGGFFSSTSCSMADFNGDGLLDIVVSNSFDQTYGAPIFGLPVFAANHPNQLFMNQGGNVFGDRSDSSGITNNGGFYNGEAGITWAVGTADVDADGDVDVVFADDQGAMPPERVRNLYPPNHPLPIGDRSLIHIFLNDGNGNFIDHPMTNTPYAASEWMGVAFGDLNCDDNLDMYLSSFGDYGNPALGGAYIGGSSSRWVLGNGDGTFNDVGVGALNATPFGWGGAIYDYDNDGDLDILFHGGLDAGNIGNVQDNPGALLQNQSCSANFVADEAAISADHVSRNVRGVAVGDLDRNGFVDIATVSNFITHPDTIVVPAPVAYGSPFDDTATFAAVMIPVSPPGVFPPSFIFGGNENLNGDLMVELNSGGNGNSSATIKLRGSVGDVTGASVNRDGIGAILSFTPRGGKTVRTPIVGGSSHSSQHALERVFGMGKERRGTLDVMWPGGIKNRLYNVRAGEQLLMPEIPCSYTGQFNNLHGYLSCVAPALRELKQAGVITGQQKARLLVSAIVAYIDG